MILSTLLQPSPTFPYENLSTTTLAFGKPKEAVISLDEFNLATV